MPPDAPDIVLLANALASSEVRYVIIGGIAMMLHGSNTLTQDCDIAIAGDSENLDHLVEALSPLRPRLLRSEGVGSWDRSVIAGPFVRLMTDAGGVDLIRHIIGVDSFAGLFERSDVLDLDGTPIRVASLDDLVAMKSVSTRDRDEAHVREIAALKKLRDA